ncbi:MAG: NADH-quinone oxidoreductase subunit L, partial [Bacteroidales bacterium]|nr:NADH-quinone oxidoreductase subunit L [Bacteroidales bacterium]
MEYSVFILLLPLLGFLFAGLGGTRLKGKWAGYVNTAILTVAAVLAYLTAWQYFSLPRVEGLRQSLQPLHWEWMRFTEHLHIDLGVMLDPISVMMLVVITTVSLMVHIY